MEATDIKYFFASYHGKKDILCKTSSFAALEEELMAFEGDFTDYGERWHNKKEVILFDIYLQKYNETKKQKFGVWYYTYEPIFKNKKAVDANQYNDFTPTARYKKLYKQIQNPFDFEDTTSRKKKGTFFLGSTKNKSLIPYPLYVKGKQISVDFIKHNLPKIEEVVLNIYRKIKNLPVMQNDSINKWAVLVTKVEDYWYKHKPSFNASIAKLISYECYQYFDDGSFEDFINRRD